MELEETTKKVSIRSIQSAMERTFAHEIEREGKKNIVKSHVTLNATLKSPCSHRE